MSFSTQAARRYFDAELLADAITNQAEEFAASLTSPAADTRLPVGMAGRVVAGLAESARWWQRCRPAHESAPVIAHISSFLSELGQAMEAESRPGVGLEALVVAAPGLKGVSMLLRETADAVDVDTVDDGLDQTIFANALRRDADLLTRLAE